jgi:hypothetical protein
VPGANTALKSHKCIILNEFNAERVLESEVERLCHESSSTVSPLLKKMRSRKLYPDTVEPLNQKGLKHTDCPLYVECLTYAVNQRWDYWSCGKCENHMLNSIYERLQFIEEYYPLLAQIYPEFRRKYEGFIQSCPAGGK